MTVNGTDNNLLFGILALQNDFISRQQLMAAISVWLQDKSQSLAQILSAQRALPDDERELLSALVKKHIEKHDQDPSQSLAAVSSLDSSLRRELLECNDKDVQTSLAHITIHAAPPDDDPGRTLAPDRAPGEHRPRFRILRPHAKGGLGQVSVAMDTELNREVALKEIQPRHADSTDSRTRFLVEAEITGSLEHPGIVPIYGLGVYNDGRPYYAMRFIRGDSLGEAVDRFHAKEHQGRGRSERAFELRGILRRFIDVCNAVEYAHSRGVLHRDLKPGNIMLGKYGETLVVDWGLAKSVGRDKFGSMDSEEPTLRPSSGTGSSATQHGSALGTPAYMSPEQAEGRLDQLGPASDVYSLGATLYYVLTGRAPFESGDVQELLSRVRRGEFQPPADGDSRVPRPLNAICMRAMAVDPADRYPSPRALADDVEAWLADEQVQAFREPVVDRALRVARRHQALVTTSALAGVILLIGLAVGLALVSNSNARLRAAKNTIDSQVVTLSEQATNLERERTAVRRERDRATRLLYASNLRLAHRAISEGNLLFAQTLLDQLQPSNDEDHRGWEWYYLRGLCFGEETSYRGHEQAVHVAAIAPDGSLVASAERSGVIKIWDSATGSERCELTATSPIRGLAWHPDGSWLLAISDENSFVWNVSSGELAWTGTVKSPMWSPADGRLAAIAVSGQVMLWDPSAAQETPLSALPQGARSVHLSHDGRLAALYENEILILDESYSSIASTIAVQDAIEQVAWSPTDSRLLVVPPEGNVRIYDGTTGELVSEWPATQAVTGTLSWDPTGTWVAALLRTGTGLAVGVWRAFEGVQEQEIEGEEFAWCGQAAPHLGVIRNSSILDIWNSRSWSRQSSRMGHVADVYTLTGSTDGSQLVSGGADTTAKVWNIAPSINRVRLSGAGRIEWTFDDRFLVTPTDEMKLVRIDAADLTSAATLEMEGFVVYSWSCHPETSVIAVAGLDSENDVGRLILWDLEGHQTLLELPSRLITAVAWDSDGDRLALATMTSPDSEGADGRRRRVMSRRGDDDAEVVIVDAAEGETLLRIPTQLGAAELAWSSGDRYLAVRDLITGGTEIWLSETGELASELRQRGPFGGTLAFHSETDLLAWVLADRATAKQTLHLIEPSTGETRLEIPVSGQFVTHLAFFSGSGRLLGSVDTGDLIRRTGGLVIWDSVTGQELISLSLPVPVSATPSHDGRRIAVRGPRFTEILDTATGHEHADALAPEYFRTSPFVGGVF